MGEMIQIEIKEDFSPVLVKKFLDKVCQIQKPCCVCLDIESRGGSVDSFKQIAGIISTMKQAGFMFITSVENYAYSCGFFLFLLGDVKFCQEDAEMLYHEVGFKTEGRLTMSKAEYAIKRLQVDDAFLSQIFIDNTEISPENFAFIKKNEVFFHRQDLVNLGIMQNEYKL